jgi:hypothetical protein
MAGGIVAAMTIGASALDAQFPRPLSPQPEQNNRVAPFFDGWYENADGTASFSFGYSNMNKETIEIPLGPDNTITPKEYDGRQPTSFPVAAPTPQDGGGGGAAAAGAAATGAGGGGAGGGQTTAAGRGPRPNLNRHDRERGVFTITVPRDFKGDVVWTLRHAGQTWSVPARTKSSAYQLSWPMAMGSTPPLLRFEQAGPSGRGPVGLRAADRRTRVGTPVDLTVWVADDAVHEAEPVKVKREAVPAMKVTWLKHSGPIGAPVTFEPPKVELAELSGSASTKAAFTQPGEYVIRVKVDTFGRVDSAAGDQCCWTNGYLKLTVTP